MRLAVYLIIYRVVYIPGGCLGFLPSTVVSSTSHTFGNHAFIWLKMFHQTASQWLHHWIFNLKKRPKLRGRKQIKTSTFNYNMIYVLCIYNMVGNPAYGWQFKPWQEIKVMISHPLYILICSTCLLVAGLIMGLIDMSHEKRKKHFYFLWNTGCEKRDPYSDSMVYEIIPTQLGSISSPTFTLSNRLGPRTMSGWSCICRNHRGSMASIARCLRLPWDPYLEDHPIEWVVRNHPHL